MSANNPDEDVNESPLSPVHRLPTELLTLVFQHIVANDSHHARSSYYEGLAFRKDLAPFLLSHVSRLWRSVALANPSFLTLRAFPEFSQGTISLLQVWLERSIEAPLNIIVEIPYTRPSNVLVLDILHQQIRRWQIIDFRLPQVAYFSPFFSGAASAPLLQDVTFELAHQEEHERLATKHLRCGYDTPALRAAFIDYRLSRFLCPESLGWSTLHSLCLDSVPAVQCLPILFQCASTLDWLVLADMGTMDAESMATLDNITFPRLRFLSFPYFSDPSMVRYIHAPELERIIIQGSEEDQELTMGMLHPFFVHCPLVTQIFLSRVPEHFLSFNQANILEVIGLGISLHGFLSDVAFFCGLIAGEGSAEVVFPNLACLDVAINVQYTSDILDEILSLLNQLARHLDSGIPLALCPKLRRLTLTVRGYVIGDVPLLEMLAQAKYASLEIHLQ